MKQCLAGELVKEFKDNGFELKEGVMEMNIFGIRNSDSQANTFDDAVGLLYKNEKGVWIVKQYAATTDPGTYYRLNPMNVDGTAILMKGQHKRCYKVGVHKNYQAMQQIGKMKYVRDKDKNGVLDFLAKVLGNKIIDAIIASNIHHASNTGKSNTVDNWSAACQVIADIKDFNDFMMLIKTSITTFKQMNLFDYTLFETNDFLTNGSNS